MTPRRQSHPPAASRIVAAGVAVGTAGGAMAFMAANDPNVIVRTVTLPALPAPPAKVIVLDGSERLLQTARHRIAGTEPGVALLEARNATGILVGRDGTRHATTNLLALVA